MDKNKFAVYLSDHDMDNNDVTIFSDAASLLVVAFLTNVFF